jgi:DNA-binding response OmpR family regulator
MRNPYVMLIEADLLVRTPLAQYLGDCGFQMVEAFDAAEARAILADASVRIDTILMDADVPEGIGFIFAAWVRANYPGIALILAGSVGRTAARAGELCEEGPALSKPFDHRLILHEIRRRLAARDRSVGDT